MFFKPSYLVALLPLAFASPVPSRTYPRSNSTSPATNGIEASVETVLADLTSGASTSQLLSDAESALSGLLKEKREAAPAPQSTAASSTSSEGLVGSLLDPVTSTVSSLLNGVLKREAAPAPQSTAASTSSGGLVGSLLDPVTSTVSSLLGGVLKREPQSASTSTSSEGLVGSLLDPVTSTVSSLLGGVLRRAPTVEQRGLLDLVNSATTDIGEDVGELANGTLDTVLKE